MTKLFGYSIEGKKVAFGNAHWCFKGVVCGECEMDTKEKVLKHYENFLDVTIDPDTLEIYPTLDGDGTEVIETSEFIV